MEVTTNDFLGTYNLVWDGWKGELTLTQPPKAKQSTVDILGTLTQGTNKYNVKGKAALKPHADIYPEGKGHRIVFNIYFSPDNPQVFDGYLMTQTKDAIAGVTWWEEIPFGFYAIKIKPGTEEDIAK